jgi:hypothetical protein
MGLKDPEVMDMVSRKKWALAFTVILICIVVVPVAILLAQHFNVGDNNNHNPISADEPVDYSPSGKLRSLDYNIYEELSRNVSNDPRVANKTSHMNLASQNFLNWGYYGNVSVLNPGPGTYRQVILTFRDNPVCKQSFSCCSPARTSTAQQN